MSDVAGIGLTDGFLTVVAQYADGVHLSSMGLDPRGEAALTTTNTGTGPGRTPPSSDDPLDTITVAPTPIDIPADDPPVTFVPIGRTAGGGYKPVTPTWTRDPVAPAGVRRLEETTISPAGFHVWSEDPVFLVFAWNATNAFNQVFTEDERSHIYIARSMNHPIYGISTAEVFVDLTSGTVLYSAVSGVFVFTVSPATTAVGSGWRVQFTVGIDSGATVEATWNGSNTVDLSDQLILAAGPTLPGDLSYIGTTGYGIILDATYVGVGEPDDFTNCSLVEAASAGSSIDASTGILTPGSISETFDVVATVGAVSGAAAVTIT